MLQSNNAGSHEYRLALEAFSRHRIHEALRLLHRAESLGYDADECAAYRWSCWMLAGCFEEAWRESDLIAGRGAHDPHRYWDGLPFTGNRVLIRCLHGLGDAIQFIRYARMVRRHASRVIVQTHPQLVSLMRGVPFADHVITWPDDPSDRGLLWDQQIEVMELPRAFRTALDSVPSEVPYIRVDSERTHRSRIPPHPGDKPRIGLQWGAGDWNAARSVPLSELQPVFELPDIQWYSFQRGAPRAELDVLGPRCRILDVSGDSPEIVEAAADLTRIDLLITVDTMLAHLAGALGRPVWVLLPWEADWRWMLDRRDSPWYPTMRLFRQADPGNWRSAVRQLVAELPAFLTGAAIPAWSSAALPPVPEELPSDSSSPDCPPF